MPPHGWARPQRKHVIVPANKLVAEGKSELPEPRGTGRRTYRKGVVTRNKVIEAAQECITDLGFSRTTSGEVTKRSGTTFGVIQYHFGSFEAVLLAVVERAFVGLKTMLEAVQITGKTAEERMAEIVEVVWAYYERPEYVSFIEIYLNLVRDPETSSQTVESLKAIDQEIERLWQHLMGRVFSTIDEAFAIQRLLFGALRGMALSRQLNEGHLDFARERKLLAVMLSSYIDQVPKGLGTSP